MSRRSVTGSAGVYLATSLANAALTFIVWPIYTRFMTPAEFGPIAMLMSLGMLWASLTDTAVEYPIIQQEREGRAEAALGFATLWVSVAFVVLLLAFAPASVFAVRYFRVEAGAIEFSTLAMLFGGIGLGMYAAAARGYLRAKRRAAMYAAITLIPSAISAGVGILSLIATKDGIRAVATGTLARGIAQAFFGALIGWRARPFRRADAYDRRQFMAISWPYIPHAVFSQLTWNIPRWSLGVMGLSADVAFFSMTSTLLRPVNMCFTALNKAWSPEAVHVRTDEDALAMRRQAELITTTASVVALAGICIPAGLIELALGAEWSGAVVYLSYLLVAVISIGFYMFPAAVFLAEKKTRYAPQVSGVAFVVTALACAILTATSGATGAGIGLMAGSVAYIAVALRLASKERRSDVALHRTIPTATIIRSVATLVAVAVVKLLSGDAAIAAAAAGACYLVFAQRGRQRVAAETREEVLVH